MSRSIVLGTVVVAAVVTQPHIASANQCNLEQPQSFGEIREGCSVTIFAAPNVDPELLEITRGGQALTPTLVHDQIVLKVTLYHSCESGPTEYENRTYERYVMSWPDLKAGDEIQVNSYPYTETVPGPGDCGSVEPMFYCDDPAQACDGFYDDDPADDDQGGCAAGGGSLGWLAIVGLAGVVSCSRRSRASSRR